MCIQMAPSLTHGSSFRTTTEYRNFARAVCLSEPARAHRRASACHVSRRSAAGAAGASAKLARTSPSSRPGSVHGRGTARALTTGAHARGGPVRCFPCPARGSPRPYSILHPNANVPFGCRY
ncbi:hypothetical protein PVAP13_2KG049832 [Panicum virgatum]|uniref:Uncharacterized protein n=1 Tax=Panicum virgatum TaxID=38727 RepID=A0A8T0VZL5_PANVG|nr:hypothetical protein PVAP13_2KG049832 [Panicum virgatum]